MANLASFHRARAESPKEVTIFAVAAQALRRWRLIAVVVVPAMALAIGYILVVPPSFTASALVEVTGASGDAISEAKPSSTYQEKEVVQTQVEAIRAPVVLNQLLEKLTPEEQDRLARRQQSILAPIADLMGLEKWPRYTPENIGRAKRLQVIVADGMRVEQVGLSAIISISYTAPDPILAAKVANELVAIATSQARERSAKSIELGLQPISTGVAGLREQLRREQEEARQFRERHQLYGANSSAALVAQLAVLNTKLAGASSEQTLFRSKIQAIGASPDADGQAVSSSTVLNSPTIARLRDRASELSGELQNLRSSLGPRHPSVLSVRSQLAELERRLAKETQVVVSSLKQDAHASQNEQDLLARKIQDLQVAISSSEQAEIRAKELDRRAAATEVVYRQLLQRETMLQQMGSKDLFVISMEPLSRAEIPWKKSHPNSVLIIVIASTIALTLGLLLVVASEQWRRLRPVQIRTFGR